jgi:hypothetical protein
MIQTGWHGWHLRSLVLFLIVLALPLTGCTKSLKISADATPELICTEPPTVDPLTLRPTPPTVIEIEGEVFWTFSTEEYGNLASNFQDIKALVEQTQAQRDHYAECIRRYKEFSESIKIVTD